MTRQLHIHEEAARCLLCEKAPCTAACGSGDPARAVRAVRFGNAAQAGRWVASCSESDLEAAERACIHYDRPIRLRELFAQLPAAPAETPDFPLGIDFCGIRCENPFFLASSAVCTNYEMVASAFEAGWAGVFYKTLCIQDIDEVSPRFDAVKRPDGSFAGFRNMEQLSENPLEEDLDILHRLKVNYPGKVVVASIMGRTDEQWIRLAKKVEKAGVDAIELNFSCPQMRLAGMGSDVGQSMEHVAFYTSYVKRAVKIPVIAKMTPNVASMTPVAMAALLGGADGISAINTIKSVTMGGEVAGKRIVSGYSGAAVKPIAQRFILEIAKNPHAQAAQLSGIGGITTWQDALEFIQLGCRNVQICTAVMEYGYRIIDDLVAGPTWTGSLSSSRPSTAAAASDADVAMSPAGTAGTRRLPSVRTAFHGSSAPGAWAATSAFSSVLPVRSEPPVGSPNAWAKGAKPDFFFDFFCRLKKLPYICIVNDINFKIH